MSISKENLALYNEILRKEQISCSKHSLEYKISGCYNSVYDAIGMTYYRIRDNHSDNQELVDYAKKEFLK